MAFGKKQEKEKKTLMQSMGVTRTVIRPREESDIQLRDDRIGRYFKKYVNKFVFVECLCDYLLSFRFFYDVKTIFKFFVLNR